MRKINALITVAAFLFGANHALAADQVYRLGSGSGPYLNAGLMGEVANKAQKIINFRFRPVDIKIILVWCSQIRLMFARLAFMMPTIKTVVMALHL